MLRSALVVLAVALAGSAYAQNTPAQKKPANPTEQAVLLGQFGDWGAYKATPGGKKICFALSKPTSAAT